MAKALIVYCHPSRRSHNARILENVRAGLEAGGTPYALLDLYEAGFPPCLTEAEYEVVLGDSPHEAELIVERWQAEVAQSTDLVFIYPVWWSDCPAKLKGWFDRVLTYGYAYFYDEAEERHTQIEIEKAIVICSAGHTVEHLEEIGIAESMRNIMLNDRLLGIGVKEASMEILGGMMPKDNTYREANLAKAYELGRSF